MAHQMKSGVEKDVIDHERLSAPSDFLCLHALEPGAGKLLDNSFIGRAVQVAGQNGGPVLPAELGLDPVALGRVIGARRPDHKKGLQVRVEQPNLPSL